MARIPQVLRTLFVLPCGLLATGVFAQSDCDELIVEMDRRIATGNYSEQNINGAKMIRSTFKGMCTQIGNNLPDDFMGDMQATIDDILPTTAEEERIATQEERRAAKDREMEEVQADMDKREAAIQAEIRKKGAWSQAEKPTVADLPQPVYAVLNAAPTAKSVVAQFVDRPDNMNNIYFQDRDVFEGRARILYKTVPSVAQFNSPDWSMGLYVAEITINGTTTQQLIVSDKDLVAGKNVVLRRSYDEIVRQRYPRPADKTSALERWSIRGAKLVASAPVPNPGWPDGNPGRWNFGMATSDGNVLYTEQRTGRTGPPTLAWFESSPDGVVLGRGSISGGGKNLDYRGELVETKNGGGAVVFNISSNDDSGMPNSEKRILTISDDATTAWESVAIERLLDFENNRSTLMIKPTANGYAVLSNMVANTNLQPPVHGPYLLELDASGMREKIYLNPIAVQLNMKITIFDVNENDIYLFGTDNNGRGVVILLDRKGEPQSFGRATTAVDANIKYQGVLSDSSGVWLYGTGRTDKSRLWVERIEFP